MKNQIHCNEKMKRIYALTMNTIKGKKHRNRIAVGWMCPVCHHIEKDESIPEIRSIRHLRRLQKRESKNEIY